MQYKMPRKKLKAHKKMFSEIMDRIGLQWHDHFQGPGCEQC